MIIDTHAHYDDEAFDKDREKLLDSMQNRGIEYIVNVGASIASCKTTVGLTRRFPNVYGALGVHPDEVASLTDEDFDWLKHAIYKPKIVAVGEIGLDYHWNDNRDEQIAWFEKQMELAREAELPIIVHSREAAKDTLDVMKASKAEEIGGIVHCFSYEKEMAREYIDMGFYLGIGGVITLATNDDTIFPNAPPITTPTAMSMTLPFMANALKSCKNVLFPIFFQYLM